MLYDNLEFNHQQQRINDNTYDSGKTDTNTVIDEYDINYRWNTEELGREITPISINSCVIKVVAQLGAVYGL